VHPAPSAPLRSLQSRSSGECRPTVLNSAHRAQSPCSPLISIRTLAPHGKIAAAVGDRRGGERVTQQSHLPRRPTDIDPRRAAHSARMGERRRHTPDIHQTRKPPRSLNKGFSVQPQRFDSLQRPEKPAMLVMSPARARRTVQARGRAPRPGLYQTGKTTPALGRGIQRSTSEV